MAGEPLRGSHAKGMVPTHGLRLGVRVCDTDRLGRGGEMDDASSLEPKVSVMRR